MYIILVPLQNQVYALTWMHTPFSEFQTTFVVAIQHDTWRPLCDSDDRTPCDTHFCSVQGKKMDLLKYIKNTIDFLPFTNLLNELILQAHNNNAWTVTAII